MVEKKVCPLLNVPPVQVQGHQHLTLFPNGQHAGGHALPLHTVHLMFSVDRGVGEMATGQAVASEL